MATVIDELIVRLGLDPSGFKKGQVQQKKALDTMRADATRTEAEIRRIHAGTARSRTALGQQSLDVLRRNLDAKRRAIRELETPQKNEVEREKKHAESLGAVKTQLIGLFAVLTAGKGLVDFVRDSISSSAAIGRFATNIGVATKDLSAWQTVVEENGGTAQDAIGTLQALSQAYQDISLRGDLSKAGDFQGLGITLADLKDPLAVLAKLQEAQKRMSAAEFTNRVTAIGIAPGAIAALQAGPLGPALARARKTAVTDADSKAAKRLQDALVDLQKSSSKLGRGILTDLAPQLERLTGLLLRLADWADQHAGAVQGAFVAIGLAAAALAIALAAPLAPFLAIAAAAAALGAALGDAYDKSPELQAAIADLGTAMKPTTDAMSDFGDAIGEAFGVENFDAMKVFVAFLTNGVDAIAAAIRTVTALLHGDWSAAWAGAKDFNRAMSDDLADGSARENARGRPGAAPAGRSGATPTARAMNTVAGLFTGLGYTPQAARGMVAGMYAESKMNPRAVNPKSGAYGIGQWLGPRKAELFRRYGSAPTYGQQLAFVQWELTHTEKPAGDAIRAAPTDAAAARAYITRYMRPAKGAETSGDVSRADGAIGIMNGTPRAGAHVAADRQRPAGATSTSTAQTDIHKIEIHTAATDADGIARAIPSAIKRSYVPNFATGLTA